MRRAGGNDPLSGVRRFGCYYCTAMVMKALSIAVLAAWVMAGPIAMAFIESWIWAALTPFVFWLSGRFSLERSRWVVHVPALLARSCHWWNRTSSAT